MLPVEVTVTAPPEPRAFIPAELAPGPVVVMFPVEVTVTAPVKPRPLAKIPAVLRPVVVIPKAPVSLVTVIAPAEENAMPGVPLAGAIAWVRLLTLRVVTGGAVKSVP